MSLFCLLHFWVILVLQFCESSDLCERFGPTHTMCLPEKECNTAPPLTEEEKQVLLIEQNKRRQKTAKGLQNGQPPASDMSLLTWNDDLAQVAQKWANNCHCDSDVSRGIDKYPEVGQNIFTEINTIQKKKHKFQSAVKEWYGSGERLLPSQIRSFSEENPDVYPYTQLVWASTKEMGCGYSEYLDEGYYTLHVVCNYGPRGNVMKKPIYKLGDACSTCKAVCSKEFDGLCDRTKDAVADDDQSSPDIPNKGTELDNYDELTDSPDIPEDDRVESSNQSQQKDTSKAGVSITLFHLRSSHILIFPVIIFIYQIF